MSVNLKNIFSQVSIIKLKYKTTLFKLFIKLHVFLQLFDTPFILTSDGSILKESLNIFLFPVPLTTK